MNRNDVRWAIAGALVGLWTAYGTLAKGGFQMEAPLIARAIANVLGGTAFMLVVSRIVKALSKTAKR